VIAAPPAEGPAAAEEVLAPEAAPGAAEAPAALEGTATIEEAPAPFAEAAGPGFFEEGVIIIAEVAAPAAAPAAAPLEEPGQHRSSFPAS
jgi:hypothetical protein